MSDEKYFQVEAFNVSEQAPQGQADDRRKSSTGRVPPASMLMTTEPDPQVMARIASQTGWRASSQVPTESAGSSSATASQSVRPRDVRHARNSPSQVTSLSPVYCQATAKQDRPIMQVELTDRAYAGDKILGGNVKMHCYRPKNSLPGGDGRKASAVACERRWNSRTISSVLYTRQLLHSGG